MKTTHKLVILSAIMVLIASIFTIWHLKEKQQPEFDFGAAPQGGDFTLESASGPFSLKSLRGKVVLVYFGYTHCPDVCPTTLAGIAQAFKILSPAEQAQTKAVFISVDPNRDTPKKLAAYTHYFSPSIIGVTGTQAQIAKVAKQYGAAYRMGKKTTANGYLISHSANTYVIDPNGKLNSILPDATPPKQIVAVIRKLLDAH